MVRNISQIVYQLFQKETLEEVSESELRYFIRQYPFAGTGHLLLAKKLQLEGEKRAFEREIAVTSIYFNNPAWLQFVLQEPNGNGSEDPQQPPLPVHPSEINRQIDFGDESSKGDTRADEQTVQTAGEPKIVLPGDADDSTNYNDIVAGKPGMQPEEYNVNEQTKPTDENIPLVTGSEYNGDEYVASSAEKIPDEIAGKDSGELQPALPDENIAVDLTTENSVEVEAALPVENLSVDIDKLEKEEEEAVDPAPAASATKSLFYDDGEVFAGFITEETNEEIRLNEETLNAPWELEEEGEDTGERNAAEDEPASDEELRVNFDKRKHLTSEVVAGDHERPESFNRRSGQIEEQPPQETEHSDDEMVDRPDLISFEAQKASQRDPLPLEGENMRAPKNDEVAEGQKLDFDPYHTIDYFASQGIKLRLEDFSRDKLGQQLKSFTEWIRSMKRLPQQVAENGMNETDQSSIRRIAEHSVEEKEVLTESMAEVWVKQGNYEKARQIYRKLSLQNPSKSTYFAAKIDQLKVL
jgi:hypothetical protein